ncbi:MAG: SWIM zinc finger family protein [Bifidobacteriaceae bacterium]|jgi:uncharacterized Zn finger protein|nr:SWIM zinc finger family protein [Bifidobacteriaceae bacterium]
MSRGWGRDADDDWGGRWYPPPSKPRAVEGGIKARSRRGAIGQSWWSERFIDVLESFGMGTRLTRGKNYARRGQVIDLEIEPGVVRASVQGSRARPYRVRIGLNAYSKDQWGKALEALAEDAWYTAKLLAGQMPEQIVDLFDSLGLALFPSRAGDLSMDCSCPDWSVPCKHLAAVFYLLAERFDDDPFAVLAWRGRDREELLTALSAMRVGAVPADREDEPEAVTPLADLLDSFWASPAPLVRATPARTPPDAILHQLPPIPLAARHTPIADALRPAYQAAATAAPAD